MAITSTDFLARFPEFQRQPVTSYLDGWIAAGYSTLQYGRWLDLLDEGVMWWVAAKLAGSPQGIAAGLSSIRIKNPYQAGFEDLCRRVAGGPYVAS